MKKTLRDYLPILMMLLCAAGFGALLLTGVIDLNTVPQLGWSIVRCWPCW